MRAIEGNSAGKSRRFVVQFRIRRMTVGSGDDGGDMGGQFRGRMVPRGRHWVGKGLLLLKRSRQGGRGQLGVILADTRGRKPSRRSLKLGQRGRTLSHRVLMRSLRAALILGGRRRAV